MQVTGVAFLALGAGVPIDLITWKGLEATGVPIGVVIIAAAIALAYFWKIKGKIVVEASVLRAPHFFAALDPQVSWLKLALTSIAPQSREDLEPRLRAAAAAIDPQLLADFDQQLRAAFDPQLRPAFDPQHFAALSMKIRGSLDPQLLLELSTSLGPQTLQVRAETHISQCLINAGLAPPR